MAGFGATDVLVRGRSRRGLSFLIAVGVPFLAGFVCRITDNSLYEDHVALFAAAEAIAFFMLPAIAEDGLSIVTGERRGPIRVDREGITFSGRALLSRAQIKNVAVEALPDGMRVIHVSAMRQRASVLVELADEAMACALIDALGFDVDRHVATFSVHEDPLRTQMKRFVARLLVLAGGAAIAFVVMWLSWRGEPLFLLMLVPAVLVYSLVIPKARIRTDVRLGVDGLMLRHRGRPRSVPLSSIVQVRQVRHEDGVAPPESILALEGGEELLLRFGVETEASASAQHAAFVTRIRQVLARRHRPRETGESLLRRGDRDAKEWARHLSSLSSIDEGYRVATLPDESLWRVAESAVSDPSARVGALVALCAPSVHFDAASRARLQCLVDQTAQRDLRAAFEAAWRGDSGAEIIVAYDRARHLRDLVARQRCV